MIFMFKNIHCGRWLAVEWFRCLGVVVLIVGAIGVNAEPVDTRKANTNISPNLALATTATVSATVPVRTPQVRAPIIVTSIKPLALIAEEILPTHVEVSYLVSAGQSPHYYALSVSQRQALADADLTLWVGSSLEQFLSKLLAASSQSVQVDALSGVNWPSGNKNSGDEHSAHHSGHDHHHDVSRDPHVWLNPNNGVVIAQALAEAYVAIHPQDRTEVERRLLGFTTRLQSMLLSWKAQLSPLSGVPLLVYHDGYRHWMQAFDLRQLAAVSTTPEQLPSVRHRLQLKRTVADSRYCLLVDSIYRSPKVVALAQELGVKAVFFDLQGHRAHSYSDMLSAMVATQLKCLSR